MWLFYNTLQHCFGLQFTSEEKLLEAQASVSRLEGDLTVERDRHRTLACDLQEAEGAVEAKDAALRGKHEQVEVLKVGPGRVFYVLFNICLAGLAHQYEFTEFHKKKRKEGEREEKTKEQMKPAASDRTVPDPYSCMTARTPCSLAEKTIISSVSCMVMSWRNNVIIYLSMAVGCCLLWNSGSSSLRNIKW